MARLQGITGGLSGKMGTAVFRQSRGETIAAQYQPIVKNPNSEGQQTQRAKFKLMSQLAAIMSPGFGTMITAKRAGKGRPSTRNTFVQINFPLVDAQSTDEGVIARIPMDQLQLTSSNRYLGLIEESQGTVSVVTTDLTISAVRFVVVGYVGNDISRPVLAQVVDVPTAEGIATVNVGTMGNVTVLAYGLIPSGAQGRATLDNIHTPTNEAFTSAIELDNLVSAGEIIETQTLGINVGESS